VPTTRAKKTGVRVLVGERNTLSARASCSVFKGSGDDAGFRILPAYGSGCGCLAGPAPKADLATTGSGSLSPFLDRLTGRPYIPRSFLKDL
jgi:hypothetical protein